jgi:hypothetical protein
VDGFLNMQSSQTALGWYGDALAFVSNRKDAIGIVAADNWQVFFVERLSPVNDVVYEWGTPQQLQLPKPKDNYNSFAYDENSKTLYVAQSKKNTSNIYSFTQDKKAKWTSKKTSFYNAKSYFTDPTLSKDGKVMILSAKVNEKYDLYITKCNENGNWTAPMRINVLSDKSNNCKPMLYGDSLLFFSSDKDNGFGGLDIWYSKITFEGKTVELSNKTQLNNLTFSEPANLGSPYNSEGDDYFLLMDKDGHGGFFSSNRDIEGKHTSRIYNFLVNPPILMKGREPNSIKEQIYEETESVNDIEEIKTDYNYYKAPASPSTSPIYDNVNTDDFSFRVQFAAMRNPVNVLTCFQDIYEHFPYIVIEEQLQEDRLNHYVTQEYQTFDDAKELVLQVKSFGIDAFVARYNNGRRIR